MFRFALVVLTAVAAGCTVWSPEDPVEETERDGPIEPRQAFEEAEEPRRESFPGREDPDGLSRDIERLQDARRKYDQERDREAAELRRRQEECRARDGSHQVPIDDGSEQPYKFCQPPPGQ